jgi:hypothetical protein
VPASAAASAAAAAATVATPPAAAPLIPTGTTPVAVAARPDDDDEEDAAFEAVAVGRPEEAAEGPRPAGVLYTVCIFFLFFFIYPFSLTFFTLYANDMSATTLRYVRVRRLLILYDGDAYSGSRVPAAPPGLMLEQNP